MSGLVVAGIVRTQRSCYATLFGVTRADAGRGSCCFWTRRSLHKEPYQGRVFDQFDDHSCHDTGVTRQRPGVHFGQRSPDKVIRQVSQRTRAEFQKRKRAGGPRSLRAVAEPVPKSSGTGAIRGSAHGTQKRSRVGGVPASRIAALARLSAEAKELCGLRRDVPCADAGHPSDGPRRCRLIVALRVGEPRRRPSGSVMESSLIERRVAGMGARADAFLAALRRLVGTATARPFALARGVFVDSGAPERARATGRQVSLGGRAFPWQRGVPVLAIGHTCSKVKEGALSLVS